MRILKLLTMVCVAAAALHTGIGLAQVPPTRFYGEIYIDGVLAPAGTEVKVQINELECGATITAEDGRYVVDAAHAATVEGCGVDDQEVVFLINGILANERGMFTQGAFKEMRLTLGAGAPPLEPAPDSPPPDAEPVAEPQLGPEPEVPPAEPEAPPAEE